MTEWNTNDHVEVNGWDLTVPGEVGKYVTKDGTTTRQLALPFGVIPRAVWEDEAKQVRGFEVDFVRADGQVNTVSVPGRFIRAASPADVLAEAGGPDLPAVLVKHVVALLFDVSNSQSNLEPARVLTHARWYGDTPWIPGNGVRVAPWVPDLNVYGRRSDVTEEQARALWAEVCTLAMGSSKMMTVLGFPFGSMYLSRRRGDTFALHITGESHQGKTESAVMAMAVFGDARKPNGPLYRTWNMSEQAPINLMKSVGIMPVYLDEAVTSGREPAKFAEMLFNLAQGRGRTVANVDGTNRGADDRWESCILSTGEMRLSNLTTVSGLRRRVLEVYSPLGDEQTHHMCYQSALRGAGWPAKWFTENAAVKHERATWDVIFADLGVITADQQVETAQAANVATCFAGFVELCRIVGVTIDRAVVLRAAREMLTKLQASARDEGADIGERALGAVREAVDGHPSYFPPAQDAVDQDYNRWGVTFPAEPGVVGVLGRAAVARIFREFGGPDDVDMALRKVSATGHLITDPRQLTGRRQYYRVGEGVKWNRLYLFRTSNEEDS